MSDAIATAATMPTASPTHPTGVDPTRPAAGPATRPVIVPAGGGRRLRAFGSELQVLLDSADTGGAIAVSVGTVPPGTSPPPHIHHREDEIFFVLDGDLEFLAADAWTRVAPGGAVFLPRGQPHTYRNPGSTTARVLAIVVPGGFEQFFAGCADVFAAAGPGAPPDVAAIQRVADAHGIEFRAPLGAPLGPPRAT